MFELSKKFMGRSNLCTTKSSSCSPIKLYMNILIFNKLIHFKDYVPLEAGKSAKLE